MRINLNILVATTAGAHLAQAHDHDHGFLHQRAAITTSSASALSSPDKPTLTGTISNCNQWYDVISGDSCWSITQAFGITQDQFETWNTAVGDSCVVQVGVSYCVGVGEVASTSTSSSATGSTASTSSVGSSSAGNSSVSTGTVTANSTSATPYSTLSYNTTTNPVTITNSDWPPSQTQTGQPSYCEFLRGCSYSPLTRLLGNNWYQVMSNENCRSILMKYSTWMSKEDL
jgi:spore germination protein YaaH